MDRRLPIDDRRQQERRRGLRHEVAGEVRLLRAKAHGTQILHGHLVDASVYDIRVCVHEALQPTDRVLLEIRDESGVFFNLTASVARVDASAAGEHTAGCELAIPMTNAQLRLVKSFADLAPAV